MDHFFQTNRNGPIRLGWNSEFQTREGVSKGVRGNENTSIYGNMYCCRGSGILDSLKSAVTTVRNALPSSDANARPLFPGETHAVLKVNGLPANANYMGPGTKIVQRIMRGDPPRSESDKAAQAHDLRYQLGVDERVADEKMLGKLRDIRMKKADNDFNINMGTIPIQAKIKAENSGILKKGKFSAIKDPMSSAEEDILRKKLEALEQEGFGSLGLVHQQKAPMEEMEMKAKKKRKKPEPLPGEELRKVLQHAHGKGKKIVQFGMGCGQRGSGIGSEPFAGPWLESDWQDAITQKKQKQKGKGIFNEPYAGPWLQTQWTDAMSGKGITANGTANEPFGGVWLRNEWQDQSGGAMRLRSGRVLKGKRKPRRARIPAVRNEPVARDEPEPIEIPSFEDYYDLGDEPEEPGPAARRDDGRPVAPRVPRVDERKTSLDRYYYNDPWPNEEWEALNESVKNRQPGSVEDRRLLGRVRYRYFGNPPSYNYPRDPLPRGRKRTLAGNRPQPLSANLYPDGASLDNVKLSEEDRLHWNMYNAAEKRAILREVTGDIDQEKERFADRMLEAKRRVAEQYPWLYQFKRELNNIIMPVFLRYISEHPHGVRSADYPGGDRWASMDSIANAFIGTMDEYLKAGRFGAEGWTSNDPKGHHVAVNVQPFGFPATTEADIRWRNEADERTREAYRQIIAHRPIRGLDDVESEDEDPAEMKTPVIHQGEGLKLAGQGLKLAGQGRALTRKLNKVCNKHMQQPGGCIDDMTDVSAKHLSHCIVQAMKGSGYKNLGGVEKNLTDYFTPFLRARIDHHIQGKAEQTGQGFFQDFAHGFQKIGLPILETAMKFIPFLA